MKPVMFLLLIFSLILLSCEGDKTVTPPEPPPGPPPKNMVTFQGKAFLDGQPEPVNALHLPLHFDIQIISYLPGDTASYDTVYTDSSGVYTSTALRQDGTYFIVSEYPYYGNDSVQVVVQDGQILGSIPELHSQRWLKIEIFADSTVYHSLHSAMFFDEIITNLNCDSTVWIFPCNDPGDPPGSVSAPTSYSQFLAPKGGVNNLFFASDINITFSACTRVCEVVRTYRARYLINFYDHVKNKSPETGVYYLYAKGESWNTTGVWYPHYKNSRHWWFKVSEPTIIEVNLE